MICNLHNKCKNILNLINKDTFFIFQFILINLHSCYAHLVKGKYKNISPWWIGHINIIREVLI